MTGSPAANTSAPWSFRSRPGRAVPGHRRLGCVHLVLRVGGWRDVRGSWRVV